MVDAAAPPPLGEGPLRWVPCRLVAGHGVASGRSATSTYPAGTIALQAPFFAAAGLDLTPFFAGTLNLRVGRGQWRLSRPDHRIEALAWTDRHPPETFSFWHCRLRLGPGEAPRAEGGAALPGPGDEEGLAALIYHPHPETKQAHHQPPDALEVLAPWIAGLSSGQALELGVDPRRCRLVDPARLRARLLEFLKFRVLAAQEAFFVAFEPAAPPRANGHHDPAIPSADPERLRAWLATLWPEALDLDDTDLLATLDQARRLYVN